MVDGTNGYAYAGNEPTGRYDPSGNLWVYYWGGSWARWPEYIGIPPSYIPICSWWLWWGCGSSNFWDYPSLHIHLIKEHVVNIAGGQAAISALAALIGVALSAGWVGAAIVAYINIRLPWYWYAVNDKNADGSFDWWVPLDPWNQLVWYTSPSMYTATPHYWWYSFAIIGNR